MIRIDRPGSDGDVDFYYDGDAVPGHPANYQNPFGELTGMVDATGSTVWSQRDAFGRILEIEKKRNSVYFVTNFAYDMEGNLQSVEYPRSGAGSRTNVRYSYNDARLVTGVWWNDEPLVNRIEYNPLSRPDLWEYANGVTVQIPTAESERNRPTDIFTVGALEHGSPADISLAYAYDTRGKVATIDFDGRVDDFSYENSRGFLTSVSYGGAEIDYTYDADGNMIERASSAFPHLGLLRSHGDNRISDCTYSASGNLESCEGRTYTYTSNNRIHTANGVVQFSYDGNDRLSETLLLEEDRVLADFYAEPLGRLSRFTGLAEDPLLPEMDWIYAAGQLVATVYHGAGEEVGDTLRLSKSGDDVDLEWNAPSECSQYYEVQRSTEASFASYDVLDDALTEPAFTDAGALTGLENYFYLANATRGSPVVRWYVADHRDSTLLVLGEGGEVLSRYEYFPFGELKTSSGCENLEGVYQGVLRDRKSDLYDLGVRHHSPDFARFLVPDMAWPNPLLPGNWNLYLYSTNDPVNFIDVLGFASRTKNGGVNPFRDIEIFEDPRGWKFVVHVAVNATGGTISEVFELDMIADGMAVALDSSNTPKARVVGGAKAAGIAAFAFTGGAVVKKTLGTAARKLRSIFSKTDDLTKAARGVPRFAQRGVSSTFRHGEFAGRTIEDVAAGLRSGAINPSQLPIQTITRDGVTYTLNNRSLMALRQAGMEPTVIRDVTGNAFFERQLTQRLGELGGQVGPDFVPIIRGGN